jgi:hypothetical protein
MEHLYFDEASLKALTFSILLLTGFLGTYFLTWSNLLSFHDFEDILETLSCG